jgi:hypothetical protein
VFKFLNKPIFRHRLTALIALFAILVHAAAPLAAHATMRQNRSTIMVLCTTHGLMRVEVPHEVGNDIGGVNQTDASGKSVKFKSVQPCALCAATAAISPPVAFSMSSFKPNSLANALFVRLGGASFVFASVVQHHAPPTGPPRTSFV